jgi:isopentenyl phosphate kinase
MANKQQRQYKKLNVKVQNGGANPLISALEHGAGAFLHPSQAIDRLKSRNSRSWKISKRHPNNVEISKR